MKIHKGDLIITGDNFKENQQLIQEVEEIEGFLLVEYIKKVSFGKLQTIRGNLYVDVNAKLMADKLHSVGQNLTLCENAKLRADTLQTIVGNLGICENAKLRADKLKTVKRNLYLYSKLDKGLEKRLWVNNFNNNWQLDDKCSEFLLSKQGKIIHGIKGIPFDKSLFDKVRKDLLTAKEVFAIENTEQRRIAYERMDKAKMKELKGYKVLDEVTDNQGNKMRIVSFKLKEYAKRFKYLDCICPSTGRNYFIETQQVKCELAKAKSFGLNKITFSEEW